MTLLHRPQSGDLVRRGGATTFPGTWPARTASSSRDPTWPSATRSPSSGWSRPRQRGAKVIHVDPRFTRTSALADLHVPIRAGSDIVFLGAIINHVLESERYFKEYVVRYTNAPVLIIEDFADTEDLDGLFSGFDPERGVYDNTSWQYAGTDDADHAEGEHESETGQHFGGGRPHRTESPPQHRRDPAAPAACSSCCASTSAATPPSWSSRSAACPQTSSSRWPSCCARTRAGSGPASFAYAVGWTQHSVGAQYIRTAAILQLLLGNIGRPGGGIMALRGHAAIQGSSDIPTLYNLLPGYLPMANAEGYPDLAAYLEKHTKKGGFWGHTDAYLISLLKAW